MKSVEIRSFFWSVFSRIWTEYGDLRSLKTECGKIRIRKNSVVGHFSRIVQKSEVGRYNSLHPKNR